MRSGPVRYLRRVGDLIPDHEETKVRAMTDAIVIGAGLAGLVAATELAAAGNRVVGIEQESLSLIHISEPTRPY